jgi:hypothetical protein
MHEQGGQDALLEGARPVKVRPKACPCTVNFSQCLARHAPRTAGPVTAPFIPRTSRMRAAWAARIIVEDPHACEGMKARHTQERAHPTLPRRRTPGGRGSSGRRPLPRPAPVHPMRVFACCLL